MKNKEKKDTAILAFAAIYSIIMIFMLAGTVFILSHKKLRSTEITKYVVETEYVYLTQPITSEESATQETTEAESGPLTETEFEMLWAKEYSDKIGIFNSAGEAVYIIDVYTKTLPEADRRLLEEGFEITSAKQLASIIQDYSS